MSADSRLSFLRLQVSGYNLCNLKLVTCSYNNFDAFEKPFILGLKSTKFVIESIKTVPACIPLLQMKRIG